MSALYQVRIESLGEFASDALEENMMILFSNIAPEEVKDYCFIHCHDQLKGEIKPGNTLKISDRSFSITAVGDVVNKNLSELGHITIRFDGEHSAEFPGCVHVEGNRPDNIVCGDEITFYIN
ncbi:PTS glucitol/sorbitol transporter subunit IIA [Salinivibrio proteolyticus]|jgi:PTS system glucitol/sorbitol-specific IIA component|uniref:PTS glucitol/sorbitol transporter subunit IIA n=1 Tax=Salinivibrio TaxID=51366 RepID=UPI000985ED01|nr:MULTISPECIES: PTS glucitol/sorbitol transporter subunit IIA [Salinivibrio]OOF26561.1 PTS glucitol/sorbitol transporter subunit IIA [Salinivibrio proteolyticus]OOF27025.1 PTS glucitol/sorbitol transporter subunit IIA [Salinivibrio sp. IB872]